MEEWKNYFRKNYKKIFQKNRVFLALKSKNLWPLQKFEVRFQMFEFGLILRDKCSEGSKFDLPKFGEFEVRFFDVRSKTNYCLISTEGD